MWAQVADPTSQSSINPLLQAPPTSTTQPHPPRVPGDPTPQWEKELDPDREHPLTRLELALVEVQRCSSSEIDVPARTHDNGGSAPTRSLSVLEKVSRFERRERAGKQRSQSTCSTQDNVPHLRVTQNSHLIRFDHAIKWCFHRERGWPSGLPKARQPPLRVLCRSSQLLRVPPQRQAAEKGRSLTGAEDLRNMLERSTSGAKAHRTMSYRGGSSEYMKYRWLFHSDISGALL